MEIALASVEDAAEILAVQKRAYQSEAQIYDDFALPPLLETVEDLRAQFASKLILKAVEDGQLVGSVRGREEGPTVHVERLIVRPDRQGRGLGARLLREIEARFPQARRFELFTGHKSVRNLHVYEKFGYRVFREQPVHARLVLVFLEKVKLQESNI